MELHRTIKGKVSKACFEAFSSYPDAVLSVEDLVDLTGLTDSQIDDWCYRNQDLVKEVKKGHYKLEINPKYPPRGYQGGTRGQAVVDGPAAPTQITLTDLGPSNFYGWTMVWTGPNTELMVLVPYGELYMLVQASGQEED
jgi:hypothetical protein